MLNSNALAFVLISIWLCFCFRILKSQGFRNKFEILFLLSLPLLNNFWKSDQTIFHPFQEILFLAQRVFSSWNYFIFRPTRFLVTRKISFLAQRVFSSCGKFHGLPNAFSHYEIISFFADSFMLIRTLLRSIGFSIYICFDSAYFLRIPNQVRNDVHFCLRFNPFYTDACWREMWRARRRIFRKICS